MGSRTWELLNHGDGARNRRCNQVKALVFVDGRTADHSSFGGTAARCFLFSIA
jgi:hypothetical protein